MRGMREYIISIAGAALLSGIARILSPAGWEKYIKIITGLIIISVIAAPIGAFREVNIFSEFTLPESGIEENVQIKTIGAELKAKVEEDINNRVWTEFSEEANSEVTIGINDKNEITGVLSITVKTNADESRLRKRLCEIYGTEYEEVIIIEP